MLVVDHLEAQWGGSMLTLNLDRPGQWQGHSSGSQRPWVSLLAGHLSLGNLATVSSCLKWE